MSETASNIVTYTPLESGDNESRWIRLEQVRATLPGPPVGDVAELVDRLYDIEPCEDGMGGGGEEAGEGPDAEQVEEELSILLERNGQCRQGWWLAAINVYRTHRAPEYELRSETATVETVEPRRESYRQVVDVSGPLIALDMPYDGNLRGIPQGVNWTVRGGTVNLDRPVHARLILRYDTWYEYVTLRVPTKKTDDGEEYEAAAVVAFWGDLAAECELEPPEPEPAEDQEEKRRLCNRQKPDLQPNDCWKIVDHYQLCECSKKRVNEWEEEAGAPCDGFSAGAFVGHEEKFDGYVGGWVCGDKEYDPELRTPEFYLRHCCKPMPFSPSRLPGCREYYAVYRGGHEIENGPEHWQNIYGSDVLMVAVLPESGICGEIITRWNIPQKNCCDGVPPMTPHPNNPEEIWPGRSYSIGVMGGKIFDAEFRWTASGGVYFPDNGATRITTTGGSVWITARENICPRPVVTVTDGCSELTLAFRGPEGDPPTLSHTDLAIMPDMQFSLYASGGVPPYTWQASGGLTLLGWSADGSTAMFLTGKREWCVENVTVIDQCGQGAACTVRNANTGAWVQVPATDYDPCDPPGRGGLANDDFVSGSKTLTPVNGFQAIIYRRNNADPSRLECPPGNWISPSGAAGMAYNCEVAGCGSSYDCSWDQGGGKCSRRRKTDGYSMDYYVADVATGVRRWVCR